MVSTALKIHSQCSSGRRRWQRAGPNASRICSATAHTALHPDRLRGNCSLRVRIEHDTCRCLLPFRLVSSQCALKHIGCHAVLLGVTTLFICTLVIALVWVWVPVSGGCRDFWLAPATNRARRWISAIVAGVACANATLPNIGKAKVAQSIANVGVSIAAAGVGFWGLVAGFLWVPG